LADSPVWLTVVQVLTIHERQIALHGGLSGVVSLPLIDSALARPQVSRFYLETDDILELGVRLCFAIAENHGFVDGNKRTGWAAMVTFFTLNGWYLTIPDDLEAAKLMERVISSKEEDLLYTEDMMINLLAPYMQEL
jgi:death-on-curing protein